jgi:hypothetical protein
MMIINLRVVNTYKNLKIVRLVGRKMIFIVINLKSIAARPL